MKKLKIILVAVLLLSLISTCTIFRSVKSSPDPSLAPPPVEWNKMYEGSMSWGATGLQQTVDGGFALFGTGNLGALLVKTDSLGNLQWNKTYEAAGFEVVINSGQQTSDGGYILAGGLRSTGNEGFLLKTDENGTEEWNKTYSAEGYEWFFSVKQTDDNGYVLAGWLGADFYLVKTDVAGNVEWSKTYGVENGGGFARSVETTSDGGYILVGSISLNSTTNWADAWIVKTDIDGNMLWNKTLGRPEGGDWLSWVQRTNDSGYIMAGCWCTITGVPSGTFWLLKTDADGNVQWDKLYGYTSPYGPDATHSEALSVQQTTDGGFIALGVKGGDVWLVRTDYSGNEIWNRTCYYSTQFSSSASQVIQTDDKGYALVGNTLASPNIQAVWLAKLMRGNPPVAQFTYAPSNPSVREDILFNASSTYDLDNDIVSYQWDFGDGNVSTDPITFHSFDVAGTYNVTLTVTDAMGLNSTYTLPVLARMITFISIGTESQSTIVGFAVNISGTLTDMYGEALKGENVVLSYTFGGVSSWFPIASDLTDNLGNYFAQWLPSATGYFLVEAVYAGNSTYAGTSNNITLSILPYSNEYVFSVESNSTISNLTFDTQNTELSFEASGLSGTIGYVRVTLAKNLAPDIGKLKIKLDGIDYAYSVEETTASWVVSLTYTHSTHQVEIDLGQQPVDEFSSLVFLALLVDASLLMLFIRKRNGRSKAH